MPARRLFTIPEPRRVALVGLGFALGFGWAWSGSLRELWLAGVLSGGLFSVQGTSAFFAALAMALLCAALGTGRLLSRLARHPLAMPGTAFSLALCAAALQLSGASALLPGVAMGLAAGLSGLFWVTALLGLPAPGAVLALALAGLFTAILAVLDVLPGLFSQFDLEQIARFRPLLVPACLLAALPLALWVLREAKPTPPSVLEPASASESAFIIPQSAKEPGIRLWGLPALAAFFALGALYAVAEPVPFGGIWLPCGLEALGAALALPLCLMTEKRREPQYVPGLGFAGALLFCAASLPAFSSQPWLARLWPSLLDGFLQGLAAAFLAQSTRASGNLVRPAGYALLLLLLTVNAGFFAGARAALWWHDERTGPAGLTTLCLAVALFPLFRTWRQARQKARQTAEAAVRDAALTAASATPAPEPAPFSEAELQALFTTWELTPKEKAVAALIRTGLSNPEIAASAGIAENTLRIHLKSLYRKSGATGRDDLKLLLTGKSGTAGVKI